MEYTVEEPKYKIKKNKCFLKTLEDLENRNFNLVKNHNTSYFTFIGFIITVTSVFLGFKDDLESYTKYIFIGSIISFVIGFYLYFESSAKGIKRMKKIYEIASKSEEEGTDPTDALTENFKKSKREKFIGWLYVRLQNLGLFSFILGIILFAFNSPVSTINQYNTNETQIISNQNTDQIISDAIYQYEECGKDSENEKTFISYALLGTGLNSQGHTEYYLVVNGQGYFLDQRGNIASSCGFGGIPTTISISQDENGPVLQEYKIARDGSEYDSSTKEMFSKQAYNIRKNGKYTFNNTEKTFLEQAEEYFGTTVIPESENNFDCSFCDKLRYYDWDPEDDEKAQDRSDLIFNYVSNDNGKNTIYFSSDGSFEAKGSWDEGTGIRVFGKDKNTIIVSSNRADHIYDRYIITNQDENNLNTILEVIQR